jgi:Phosphoglucomutase/phosphomannomutase, alpha/beta/alpha domain I
VPGFVAKSSIADERQCIMAISPLAGRPAPKEILVDLNRLEREYSERQPDLGDPNQLVSFGTSGHRGTPLSGTFTEAHILAITQAICDFRRAQGTDGPLYMGKDTHALSAPAQRTALELLAATESKPSSRATMARRRRRRFREPFSSTTAAARSTSRTASSSRRRTIRPRTAASSTTRPTAAPPTPM